MSTQPELLPAQPTGLTSGWWSPAPSAGSESHFIGSDGRSLCGEWCWLGPQISGELREEAPGEKCVLCEQERRLQGL